jgi:hypothetical protein
VPEGEGRDGSEDAEVGQTRGVGGGVVGHEEVEERND